MTWIHTFVLGELPLVAEICNFTHGSQTGAFNTNSGPTEISSVCNPPDEFLTAVPLSYQLFSHLFHHSKVTVILPQVIKQKFSVIQCAPTALHPKLIAISITFLNPQKEHAPTPLRTLATFQTTSEPWFLQPDSGFNIVLSHWLVVKWSAIIVRPAYGGKGKGKVHQINH